MDKLKDFIRQNRASFDQEELPNDHLSHFMEKLASSERMVNNDYSFKKTVYLKKTVFWLVAASIAAAMTFTLFTSNPVEKTAYTCELDTKKAELRMYYQMKMEDLVMQMESETAKTGNPAFAVLVAEGKKIQSACERFDEDVTPTLPCSEKGIYAINQQYANSLAGIQILYNQLMHIKKE